ncbi:MAG: glycoside hydrolase family 3 N-terminal domain-containing protein [Rhodothermales bacterium]
MVHPRSTRAICAFAMILVFAGRLQAQDAPAPLYRNAAAPIDQRVEDLLGRMTLEEKVGQMQSLWQGKAAITDAEGRFDPTNAPEWFRIGIGRIERPADGHTARGSAEFTNAIQRWVIDNTRLGIPVLFHDEALHGVQGAQATSYPQAIALASTWNPDLLERIFAGVASEARARGAQQVLAPVVDVAREPRWGRIEETYGEDPYLAAQMGIAAVRGFQGAGAPIHAPHVIATLKHMAGHGQPESGMNIGPANFSERVLRDVFFYPFETVIREAGPLSLMPSYNEIDGIPSHGNTWMLKEVLREEWGFDGVIVSDWEAIRQMINRHHVAADHAEAARRALAATVDIELPDIQTYYTLVDEVRAGRVPESAIDTAVRRLLKAKFLVGLFEHPFVDPDEADAISGAASFRPLALEAAQQAITLLKNDNGLLPLRADRLKRVAVIGPHAAEVLLGGYAGRPRHTVSIYQGLQEKLAGQAEVVYAEGVRITEDTFTDEPQPHMQGERSYPRWNSDAVQWTDPRTNRDRIARAVAQARRSDVAIVVVGDNEKTSREAWAENHLGDRSDIGLPGQQAELVRAIVATGKPVVLVLIHGSPLAIPDVVDSVPAILDGWYLGQETGTAVADALFGDINPGGKLPLTIPRDIGQLPMFYNHKPSWGRGYLTGSTEPLFPFGYGLSYTTFGYANLRLEADAIGRYGATRVMVDVTNTGDRAGDEVVQLYIRDQVSRVARPVKELRGFRRITLQPGETQTVSFEIGPDALSYHGLHMERVVEPGAFDVMVGGNSADLQTLVLTVTE